MAPLEGGFAVLEGWSLVKELPGAKVVTAPVFSMYKSTMLQSCQAVSHVFHFLYLTYILHLPFAVTGEATPFDLAVS